MTCKISMLLRHGWQDSVNTHCHQVTKLIGELGANAAVDNFEHLSLVIGVNGEAELIHNLDSILQSSDIAPHNHSRVNILLQKWLCHV